MTFETQNRIYTGWTKGAVVVSMETLANHFNFTGNNRFIEDAENLKAGEPCSIYHPEGYEVVNGYIDKISTDIEGNITVSGRDKSGDLVDSSMVGTGQLDGLSLIEAIAKICEPFGITVTGESGRTINKFGYGKDDSCADVIRSLATRQGFLVNSDGVGGLVIQTPNPTGKASIALIEGVNIIKGSNVEIDYSKIASSYQVLGQSWDNNRPASTFEGTANRYRPSVAITSQRSEYIDCEESAEMLCQYMEGSAQTYNIVISELVYLLPNTLIELTSGAFGMYQEDLLIRSVQYVMEKGSLITSMVLSPPYIYGGNKVENTFL